MRLLATVALAALAAGCTASQTAEGPSASSFPVLAGMDKCSAVTPAMLGATSASGKWVAEANGLPGFCEVTATLYPGRQDQRSPDRDAVVDRYVLALIDLQPYPDRSHAAPAQVVATIRVEAAPAIPPPSPSSTPRRSKWCANSDSRSQASPPN